MANTEKRKKPTGGPSRTPGSPHGVDPALDTLRQIVWNNEQLIRDWREMEGELDNNPPRGRRIRRSE